LRILAPRRCCYTEPTMTRIERNRHRVLLLLLATLLMRVAIPVGYMPAAAGSGLLFELCPEGMPASVMQALGGHHHHHQAHSDRSSNQSEASFDAEQCPVGHMLSSAMATEAVQALDVEPVLATYACPVTVSQTNVTRTAYRSRAPPTELL
jgi:hypothetical protein